MYLGTRFGVQLTIIGNKNSFISLKGFELEIS